MDSRTARRAAVKAARNLITTRAALVGELGVTAAERTQLADDIAAAIDRGRQLVAAAETEADRLVAAAQTSQPPARRATPTPTPQQRKPAGPPLT